MKRKIENGKNIAFIIIIIIIERNDVSFLTVRLWRRKTKEPILISNQSKFTINRYKYGIDYKQ